MEELLCRSVCDNSAWMTCEYLNHFYQRSRFFYALSFISPIILKYMKSISTIEKHVLSNFFMLSNAYIAAGMEITDNNS